MIRPGWETVRRVLKLSSVARRPRRVAGSTPALLSKSTNMAIYLDTPDDNDRREIRYEYVPTPTPFAASMVTSMEQALEVKPETVCLECGNAAATHRWDGGRFWCPGTKDRRGRALELAEQYVNDNIAADVRKNPDVQKLIGMMADALELNDRGRADAISKLILRVQYEYERLKNTLDKNIKPDQYEQYIQMRGMNVSRGIPIPQGYGVPDRTVGQELNDLENRSMEQAELAPTSPLLEPAVNQALVNAVNKVRLEITREEELRKIRASQQFVPMPTENKPASPAPRAPRVMKRPKRNYGDDY